MAELEEKLNAILGNQQAMGQIMALARSLSGEGEPSETEPLSGGPAPCGEPEESGMPGGLPDLQTLLGTLDPAMVRLGLDLLRDSGAGSDRGTALLEALKPFLREERRAKLDRAVQIARVTRLVRLGLNGAGEKGEERRV